jgi:hypothetical protein
VRFTLPLLAVLTAACTREGPHPADQPVQPVIALELPDATHPALFTRLTDVHELADGRVLVSDNQDKSVVLIDFTTGTSNPVGRRGRGPGEYVFPGQFYPQPDGTILLNDFFTQRLLVIDDTGGTGDVIPFPKAAGIGIEAAGYDDRGRIYFRSRPWDFDGPGAPGGIMAFPDSLAIMRWDPTSGTVDTAGWVAAPRIKLHGQDGDNEGGVSADPPVFTPGDVWGVTPDGGVARVTPDPYRIIWYTNGSATAGPIQAYTQLPVTEADRQAHYEGEKGMRPIMLSISGDGNTSISEGPPSVGPPGRREFAATKPPFLFDADIHVTPDGQVWVPRARAADDSIPRYDIFDRSGRKIQQVTLNPSSSIIGFGRGTVYVIRVDGDDFQHLERFRR